MKFNLTLPLKIIVISIIISSIPFNANAFVMKICTTFLGSDPSGNYGSVIDILTTKENWALWAPDIGNLTTGDPFNIYNSSQNSCDDGTGGVTIVNVSDNYKNVLMTNTRINLIQQNPREPFPDPDVYAINNSFSAPALKYCDKFLLSGTWSGSGLHDSNVNFSISPVDCNFPETM